jgi:hypothetical protein
MDEHVAAFCLENTFEYTYFKVLFLSLTIACRSTSVLPDNQLTN